MCHMALSGLKGLKLNSLLSVQLAVISEPFSISVGSEKLHVKAFSKSNIPIHCREQRLHTCMSMLL